MPAVRAEDVPLVPSPPAVIEAMLKLAGITNDDFVVDLGCGDGRIVIAAARQFNARARGVEFNPRWVELSRTNARNAGVAGRVDFVQDDFFRTDLSGATVVTLYLSNDVNVKLRPKLVRQLKVGSRIVSHIFDMGDWQPDKVGDADGRMLRLWIVTEKAKTLYGNE